MVADAHTSVSGGLVEQRYLTIVFCDLCDFTWLSDQIDAESLHVVRDGYQRQALEAAARYGGFVSNFTGDGILIYFGYPAARENDAERAVRASLDLVDAIKKMSLDIPTMPELRLNARIGIHTGLVLMAPEQSSGGVLEHSVVGQAVNLASRLQMIAEPGAVVVSRDTHELVENWVESQFLGLQSIRGIGQPVGAYRILGSRQGANRSGGRFRRGGTRLVGRVAALDTIRSEWADTLETYCARTVVLEADAGLGKTRLALEFCRLAELQADALLQLNCYELFSQTPLYPITSALSARANLALQDTDEARLVKLRTFLESFGLNTAENMETARSLFETLGAPLVVAAGSIPAEVRKSQFGLLTAILYETIKRGPHVLWLEDAHWLDPSSAELLIELAVRVADLPNLLLVTTRHPAPHYLSNIKSSTTTKLAPLSAAECLELAYSVPGAKPLPPETVKQVVELADGSPLFVEQLTLSLIDSHSRAPGPGERKDVLPLTLAEMISERLDRLRGGRSVVQFASCLGRAFAQQTLEELLDKKPGELGGLLDQLVTAEILRRQDGRDGYEFRHALLQHAAHDLMLPSARRTAHRRIAEAFAAAQGVPTLPEVLAHHWAAAGRPKEAVDAWLRAATLASRRSAYAEAIAHIERGLGLVGQIADAGTSMALELGLQASLIGPLTATGGATHEKVLACCQRGLRLCNDGPPTPLVFAFLFGQFTHAICRAKTDLATTSAERFLSTAANARYESGKVIGHRLTGMVCLGKGQVSKSIEELEKSLDLYDAARDEAATHVFGQNAQVHSRSLLSFALLHAGRIDEALQAGNDALRSLDELKHPHSSALALGYVGGWVFGLCGLTDGLMAASRRLVVLAEKHDIGNMRRFGQAFIGWALCQAGDVPQGIAYLDQAVTELESIGFQLTLPTHMTVLADALRQVGRRDEASDLCRRALEIVEDGGERLPEPEIRRVQALLAAEGEGGRSAARDIFCSAFTSAQKVESVLAEYRVLRTMSDTLGPGALDAGMQARLTNLARFGMLKDAALRVFGPTISATYH
jgi:class 3 adenylate cyclase/tetratricopeptide (TPR) repeat protein